ncbi:MAG: SPFH domain-containing protein [Clostridiales Family XIII bacterium]|jgi:membrane protease subunit (stomatin/prohibitin family)|nr:SPFH domain-containing protein [Clostridiales Family XIII bacterium]
MGLIDALKTAVSPLVGAATSSIGGVLADQWLEFFKCDSLESDVLVIKGQKYTGGRGSNNKGSDNVISNGSGIIVADGQCMIIVDQGKIAEICAVPGHFTYDASSEPSIFYGNLGANIINTFKNIGARFTYGGSIGKDQRVYYFNTKEIISNKYGTQNPVPFRVVDANIGLDVDIAIRCNGEYSYKITDPILFYMNVVGNVTDRYTRDQIDSQLKTELLTALQPAFARISEMGVRYSALPAHTMEISDALNEILSQKWRELRGIQVASFGINSVTASKEDEDMIKEFQRRAVLRDPSMAAATLTEAQADAMRAAAANESGAMMGFMGLGFAQQAGGTTPQGLYQMAQQQQGGSQTPGQPGQGAPIAPAPGIAPGGGFAPAGGFGVVGTGGDGMGVPGVVVGMGMAGAQQGGYTPQPPQAPQTPQAPVAPQPPEAPQAAPPAADPAAWTCPACGHAGNDGKFCEECGAPKPIIPAEWTCTACGHTGNDGKFCEECGAKRP